MVLPAAILTLFSSPIVLLVTFVIGLLTFGGILWFVKTSVWFILGTLLFVAVLWKFVKTRKLKVLDIILLVLGAFMALNGFGILKPLSIGGLG